MSLPGAKGLELEYVLVTGLEAGIFSLANEEYDKIEEERNP
mgnify:CR=1 FL=1